MPVHAIEQRHRATPSSKAIEQRHQARQLHTSTCQYMPVHASTCHRATPSSNAIEQRPRQTRPRSPVRKPIRWSPARRLPARQSSRQTEIATESMTSETALFAGADFGGVHVQGHWRRSRVRTLVRVRSAAVGVWCGTSSLFDVAIFLALPGFERFRI